MGLVILTNVFAFILPAIFVPLFILVSKKDKRRNKDGTYIVGTYGQAKEVVALIVFGALCYIGFLLCGSLCYVFDKLLYGYIFVPIISVFCFISYQGAIATRYGYLVFHDDCIMEARIFLHDREIPYSAMQYYLIGVRLPVSFFICDKNGKGLLSLLETNAAKRARIIQLLEEKAILPISHVELEKLQKIKINKTLRKRNNAIGMAISSVLMLALALLIFLLPVGKYQHYEVEGTVESFKIVNNTKSLYEFTLADDSHRYELDRYAVSNIKGDPKTIITKGCKLNLKIAYSYVDGRCFVSYIERDGNVYLSTADYDKSQYGIEIKNIASYIFFAIAGVFVGLSVYFFVSYTKSKRKQ